MDDTAPSGAPHTRPGVRPRHVATAAVGVVVVVLSLLVATGALAEEPPRARVGDVLVVTDGAGDWGGDADLGGADEVLLPWARLEVRTGPAVTELAPDSGSAQLAAPAGGSLVPLRVDLDLERSPELPTVPGSAPVTASAVLRAGGRDYPLTDPGGLDLGPWEPGEPLSTLVWVAVDGEPDDVRVAVDVDGQTQVAGGDPGRAAALADVPTQGDTGVPDGDTTRTPCGRPVTARAPGLRLGRVGTSWCRVDAAFRTPYVAGVGWADEGRDLVVVEVRLDVDRFRPLVVVAPGELPWQLRDPLLDVRLDGAEPVVAVDPTRGFVAARGTARTRSYVFDVPSDQASGDAVGELDVRLTMVATTADPFDTRGRDVRLDWRIPAGGLR